MDPTSIAPRHLAGRVSRAAAGRPAAPGLGTVSTLRFWRVGFAPVVLHGGGFRAGKARQRRVGGGPLVVAVGVARVCTPSSAHSHRRRFQPAAPIEGPAHTRSMPPHEPKPPIACSHASSSHMSAQPAGHSRTTAWQALESWVTSMYEQTRYAPRPSCPSRPLVSWPLTRTPKPLAGVYPSGVLVFEARVPKAAILVGGGLCLRRTDLAWGRVSGEGRADGPVRHARYHIARRKQASPRRGQAIAARDLLL